MKKLFFGLMILAGSLITTGSFAQHQKADPGTRAKKVSEKMKTELALSDVQYNQVYDINLKYDEKMQSLRRADIDREKKFTEIKAIRKAKHEELKAVLSKEQMEKYHELKKETKEKMRNHRKAS